MHTFVDIRTFNFANENLVFKTYENNVFLRLNDRLMDHFQT